MGNNIQYDLETACKEGDLQTVKHIVETPLKWYNEKMYLGESFVIASKNNHWEIVKYLWEKMKEPGKFWQGTGSFSRTTSLKRAFRYTRKNLEMAQFLIDQAEGDEFSPVNICEYGIRHVGFDLVIRDEVSKQLALAKATVDQKYDIVAYLATKKF